MHTVMHRGQRGVSSLHLLHGLLGLCGKYCYMLGHRPTGSSHCIFCSVSYFDHCRVVVVVRVSSSPGCPQTCFVVKKDIEFPEILPLSPECSMCGSLHLVVCRVGVDPRPLSC